MKKYIAITIFALAVALLSVFVRNVDAMTTTSDTEQTVEVIS